MGPRFDPLRSDLRFQEILRYLRLDEMSLQEVKEIVSKPTS